MNQKQSIFSKIKICPALIFFILFVTNVFSIDDDKQKSDIDKSMDKLQELLSALKFQDARSTIDLLNYKLGKAKKVMSGDEVKAYNSRLDNAKKIMALKEDSLVNVTYDILKSQGQDSALLFIQNFLRVDGVSESKINSAEKKVLEEGPAIKQAKDQEKIANTIKILESGQTPPPSTDAFILQSAQRVVKRHADSLKVIENAKAKKDMDERIRLENIQREKEAKAALEKKAEEERIDRQKRDEGNRIAKQKKDDEQKRQDSIATAENKRLAIEQEQKKKQQEQFEAQRRDSLKRVADAREEKDRQAQEDQRKRNDLARLEQARRDSMDAYRKAQDQLESQRRMVKDQNEKKNTSRAEIHEKAVRDSIELFRKFQEQTEKQHRADLALQEQLRSDSIAAVKKSGKKRRDNAVAAIPDNGISVQQGKSRNDSSEAQRWGLLTSTQNQQREDQLEKERLARLIEQEKQRKILLAQHQEKAHQDSIDAQHRILEQLKEKNRQDSIAMVLKLKMELEKQQAMERKARIAQEAKERMARQEEDRRRSITTLAQQKEKARQDSIDASAARKNSVKNDNQDNDNIRLQQDLQREREKSARLEEQLKQQGSALQEKQYEDGTEAYKKFQSSEKSSTVQANPVEQDKSLPAGNIYTKRIDNSATVTNADDKKESVRNDEGRKNDLKTLQEKARLEYQKKIDEENARNEKERRKNLVAIQQQRGDSITPDGKKVLIRVDIDQSASKYDSYDNGNQNQVSSSNSSNYSQTKNTPVSRTKNVKDTPQKLKEKQKLCEKYIADIYNLIERNRNRDAIQLFISKRDFIEKYSDPEVFSTLDQTISGILAP
jgi:hypothetical protein